MLVSESSAALTKNQGLFPGKNSLVGVNCNLFGLESGFLSAVTEFLWLCHIGVIMNQLNCSECHRKETLKLHIN